MFVKNDGAHKKRDPSSIRCVPFLILCGGFLECFSKSDGSGKATKIAG